MYSFPNLEPVCCSMSGSNCCFLTCIQISQEAGQVVWYSHLFKNVSQFVVIHAIKGFSINEAEVDVFLEFFCLFYDPTYVGNLMSGCSGSSQCTMPEQVSCFKHGLVICFIIDNIHAVLSKHPTLAFSHRVQNSVLYICVSFSVLHIGLSLPSF